MIFNMALGGLFVPELSERAINSLMERLRNRGGSFRSKIVDGHGREKDVYVLANPVNVRSTRLAAILLVSVELL
jgi:hypothetical protein